MMVSSKLCDKVDWAGEYLDSMMFTFSLMDCTEFSEFRLIFYVILSSI